MAYRGLLFDLFGTLVHFDARRLPALDIAGERVRTTVAALGGLLEAWVPGATPEAFWRALLAVSEEMAQARTEQLIELPSRERFRRALERVGCADDCRAEAAVILSRAHMAAIVAATVLPPEHATLLAALRPSYRLGVVSNFDDTGAAYEILARHGVLPLLDTVVVSEALGLRKPHPALVRTGLRGLGLAPREPQRLPHRRAWRPRPDDAGQVAPRAEHDDRTLEHARQRHLGERPVETGQRDHRVARGRHQHVACVTEARRQAHGEVRVPIGVAVGREEPHHHAAPSGGAACRRLHHAAQPSADENGACGGDLPADGLREPRRPRAAGATARDADLRGARAHGRSRMRRRSLSVRST